MERYGWKYHSDRKARKLWKQWDNLAEVARRDPALFARAEGPLNFVELYYEVHHGVHLAKDKRIRRNVPPPP
jgi:hypothetical protein